MLRRLNKIPYIAPQSLVFSNFVGRRFFSEIGIIREIEASANANPSNPELQNLFLKTLNRRNQWTTVVRRYTDPRFVRNYDTHNEYAFAMSKLGRRLPVASTQHQDPTPYALQYENAAFAQQGSLANARTRVNEGSPDFAEKVSEKEKENEKEKGGSEKKEEKVLNVRVMGSKYGLFFRLLPTILIGSIVVLFLYIQSGSSLSKLTSSQSKKVNADSIEVTFEDVKGIDEAREEIQDIVMYLRNPAKFEAMGARMPKGVLLVGEPGTGKTLLARAIAGEAGVPFFSASGSEFDEMFVGLGSKRIRDLFAEAKKNAPSIIFIDEIDSLGSKRQDFQNNASKATLNQLLTELDGFQTDSGVVVIGATNLFDSLDAALVRPGRFDKIVNVPLPDIKGRKQIIDLYLANVPKSVDVSSERLARSTPGMSGADLFNVINSAAIKAAKQGRSKVNMRLLEEAFDDVSMGVERRSAVIPADCRRLTAFHEAGHATVSYFTDGTNPIRKATIVSRGRSLGMVASMLTDKDSFSVSKKELLAKIATAMGGRAGEEILMGKEGSTTGASSDFQQATSLASRMVTQWGMSEKVGYVFIGKERETLSSDAKQLIDSEIQSILQSQFVHAKTVLKENEFVFRKLADALLEHETLTGEEITQILKGEEFVKKADIEHKAEIENKVGAGFKIATTKGLQEDTLPL
eukprot:TRINITY_DN10977_c0_g1_i1.p1 TRINITY_DN10977_c0_g1~~TRINITY_DN10977_c0_g1_i1.p1  ORF type:complete len:701 (-),score=212.13 TRINITY_DN10977_c0_g1_i1:96-2165(-)